MKEDPGLHSRSLLPILFLPSSVLSSYSKETGSFTHMPMKHPEAYRHTNCGSHSSGNPLQSHWLFRSTETAEGPKRCGLGTFPSLLAATLL